MKFSAEELEVRRPLWAALSDLYLDTEPDWERVAALCATSPFEISALRRILFDEVHPRSSFESVVNCRRLGRL